MGFVLASKSPRRQELLGLLNIHEFAVHPADIVERTPPGLSPGETVRRLACLKARNVAPLCPRDVVIAADTLVYLDGVPLGKPTNTAEAEEMLRALSGRGHTVCTGVCVVMGEEEHSFFETTGVFFRRMSEEEIRAYVATGEPMDKAGAYAVQGRGAIFINRICGDYFNVMGLPVCRLHSLLTEMGITL